MRVNIKNAVEKFILFTQILLKHITHDRLTTFAAGLAYTTILSIIPLITVIFSLFSLFPTFSSVSQDIKIFIYDNLAPAASDAVYKYFDLFIENTNNMTLFGVISLVLTSLLLIRTIDQALNFIWKTKRKRSFFYNFTIYWTVLTFVPVIVALSMLFSSYWSPFNWISDPFLSQFFAQSLSFFIYIIGFWLLYCLVPTEPVPIIDSLIGAIVTVLLLELGRYLFVFYVSSFPTYQLIYGVLSSIPLLLLWVYLSWCIIIFGAEIAVSLIEFKQKIKKY